jgi:hypothetical protein
VLLAQCLPLISVIAWHFLQIQDTAPIQVVDINITRNQNIFSLNTTLFYKENQLPVWVNDGSRQQIGHKNFKRKYLQLHWC